jgi:hypothetical protein
VKSCESLTARARLDSVPRPGAAIVAANEHEITPMLAYLTYSPSRSRPFFYLIVKIFAKGRKTRCCGPNLKGKVLCRYTLRQLCHTVQHVLPYVLDILDPLDVKKSKTGVNPTFYIFTRKL